jgi:hypothetical protein
MRRRPALDGDRHHAAHVPACLRYRDTASGVNTTVIPIAHATESLHAALEETVRGFIGEQVFELAG